jgi:hypothetical protein
MTRGSNNLLLLSFALIAIVTFLWARSYIQADEVFVRRQGHTRINSHRGCLTVIREDFFADPSGPQTTRHRITSSRRLQIYWSVDSDYFAIPKVKSIAGFFWGSSILPWYSGNRMRQVFQIPYWSFLLLAGAPILIWLSTRLRARFHRRRGRCQACGYDLRESRTRCPECGSTWHVEASLPWRDRLGAQIALHRRRFLILAASLACAFAAPLALRAAETESDQIDRLIRQTCVDSGGNLDGTILDGSLRPMIVDADLNGDGVPERIVLFYFWPKWGDDPESAARYFRSHTEDGWDVNALLILAGNGKSWRAASKILG